MNKWFKLALISVIGLIVSSLALNLVTPSTYNTPNQNMNMGPTQNGYYYGLGQNGMNFGREQMQNGMNFGRMQMQNGMNFGRMQMQNGINFDQNQMQNQGWMGNDQQQQMGGMM